MSDYPEENEINTIKNWKFDEPGSFAAFLAYVKSIGHYWKTESFGFRQARRRYYISTGGWSGNEEIIGAMRDNFIFWSVCWLEHRRGGHYIFAIPDDKTYWRKP